jgi:hypothetical protein
VKEKASHGPHDEDRAIPVYLVERILPGTTLEAVEVMGHTADAMCRTFTARGKSVRFLRSTFVPGESRCRCLFEAPSADVVQEVNDAAQLPYNRIVVALDLPNGWWQLPTQPSRQS